ncbi:MAG: DNA glycosylase AlkZ-like family protein [Opitutaceae bacterium]
MRTPGPLIVTPLAARRFLRRVLGFDRPHANIAAALAHHGYIQVDPLNICGRMHDLILRNRVAGYREGDLMRFLHGEVTPLPPEQRRGFEHHVPGTGILAAFPLEAWPHLLAAMRDWSRTRGVWAGRLTPREKALAGDLLVEIRARGPLGSEDFDDARRARKVWGAAKLVKATLQKLFFHGRVLIAQRTSHRRRYDLPERVLPPALLAQTEASPNETARWLALLKVRQRRLVTLKREDLRLIGDSVHPVTVEGCPPLYCLPEDVGVLASSGDSPEIDAVAAVSLLAPLDPLIYDRRLTAALWGFDYTWEAYTPPLKRVRGHYALPVLAGTGILGHVNPKADRSQRRLVITSRRIRRGHNVGPALHEFAAWLGLSVKNTDR